MGWVGVRVIFWDSYIKLHLQLCLHKQRFMDKKSRYIQFLFVNVHILFVLYSIIDKMTIVQFCPYHRNKITIKPHLHEQILFDKFHMSKIFCFV